MALARKLRTVLRAPLLLSWLLGSRGRSVGSPDGHHVVLAPPGGGNIGDQALVEAFIAGVAGRVTVIVRSLDAFRGLDESPGVTVRALPNLLHGPLASSVKDSRTLRKLWVGAASFSVIGADVMDGAYDWRASVTRSTLARRAALDGVNARVVGFSWNSAPHRRAARALQRASQAGVQVFARDTASGERLVSIVPDVEHTADIVFTDERRGPLPPTLAPVTGNQRPYVLVNASGLVARSVDQTGPYVEAVRTLLASGHDVVLLPHVIRLSGDDLGACQKIWQALPEEERERVVLVEELLRPAQVRRLAAGARLVIAGRMHLGVMAFSQGVPAIVIATQGKVEGLMAAFDAADLLVTPADISAGAIATAIDHALSAETSLRSLISDRGPLVKDLARKNFAGLD